MTDVTGRTPTNGAPRPQANRGPAARPKAGDAQASPVIKSMADSLSGELGAEGTSNVAKPKSQAPSSARAPAAKPAAAKPGSGLSEEDSVLVAGIDEAAARAQALRDWALIRREEAKDAVRAHPLGSSVMVFAAGMIFGLLLARR